MFDELGNIGDFVGGLAVVVTLVYLALQIRQNTATTRVQTVQHLLTSDTAAADSTIAGPVPEILAKLEREEELSPTERGPPFGPAGFDVLPERRGIGNFAGAATLARRGHTACGGTRCPAALHCT